MKVYWKCRCDYGHEWGGFFEEDAVLPTICTEGHEAVQISKYPPIDQVQVSIRPAGRIVDQVKGQVHYERHAWVVIESLSGDWSYTTKKMYIWREAEKIIRLFERSSIDGAKETIRLKGL